jgi:Transposase DDE domain
LQKKVLHFIKFFWTKTKKRRTKMNLQSSLVEIWSNTNGMIAQIFKPKELSNIARKTKFIQRSTSLLQGKDFLEMMTTASIDPKSVSLEALCGKLRDRNPEADLTPQSLMERINQPEAVDFLKTVFQNSLKTSLENTLKRVPPIILASFNNVWIEDCSECVLNEHLAEAFKGSSGVTSKSCVKLDLIYEIKKKNIFSVDLTDRRSPDQKLAQRHLEIVQKGDLWIRDLGFFDVSVFKTMVAIGAFFLSRLPACVYVYINKEDKDPVDIAEYINHNFPNHAVIDMQVFVTTEKFPVRLIAYRAPKELAEKRRREANKEAKKKGKQRSKASKNRLDFSFFITNVPKEIWEAEVIGTVYTVRWQIELIFKSWKSQMQINYLKGINPDRIRCLLYGKLIIISIINIIYKLCDWYAQKLDKEISLPKVVNWLKTGQRLSLIVFEKFSYNLFNSLIREIPRTLSKKKGKRKTTQDALEEGIPYCDLYANLYTQVDDYKRIKVS